MRRFLKRLAKILLVVLILCAAGAAVMYHLSTRTPEGYAPNQLTEEQRRAAAQRADQIALHTVNIAGESLQSVRDRKAGRTNAATRPEETYDISFSQDELNAFLLKWADPHKPKYEAYVTAPYIRLDEGRITLMATIPEYGKVMSIYLEPRLEPAPPLTAAAAAPNSTALVNAPATLNTAGAPDAVLRCDIAGIRLGSLPIPEALLSSYREKVVSGLKSKLPQWQKEAKIDPNGVANEAATSAAMGLFLLQTLDRQPTQPVIFLQLPEAKSASRVPVRLTAIRPTKGALSVTVRPMESQERTYLFESLKRPYLSPGEKPPAQNTNTAALPQPQANLPTRVAN